MGRAGDQAIGNCLDREHLEPVAVALFVDVMEVARHLCDRGGVDRSRRHRDEWRVVALAFQVPIEGANQFDVLAAKPSPIEQALLHLGVDAV